MPKRDRQRTNRANHAKHRAAERYALALTRRDLEAIVALIRDGRVIASQRLTCSKSVKLIEYQGRRLVLLYSKRHREIVTFLPADCREARLLADPAQKENADEMVHPGMLEARLPAG